VIGLFLAAVGAVGWRLCWFDGILGSLLIGIGSSAVAAALVAYFSPLNEEIYEKFLSLGIQDVYSSRSRVPNARWVEWLSQATRNCTLLGIAHGNWCRDPDFPSALENRLRNKVQVKIFFLDPTSPVAEARAREDKPRDTIRTIRESIKFVWDLRNRIGETEPDLIGRLRLYVYDATPSSGVTWIDEFMLVTHYLGAFANLTSPAFLIQPVRVDSGSRDLFSVYAENVRNIEEQRSTEITEGNVEEYT